MQMLEILTTQRLLTLKFNHKRPPVNPRRARPANQQAAPRKTKKHQALTKQRENPSEVEEATMLLEEHVDVELPPLGHPNVVVRKNEYQAHQRVKVESKINKTEQPSDLRLQLASEEDKKHPEVAKLVQAQNPRSKKSTLKKKLNSSVRTTSNTSQTNGKRAQAPTSAHGNQWNAVRRSNTARGTQSAVPSRASGTRSVRGGRGNNASGGTRGRGAATSRLPKRGSSQKRGVARGTQSAVPSRASGTRSVRGGRGNNASRGTRGRGAATSRPPKRGSSQKRGVARAGARKR